MKRGLLLLAIALITVSVSGPTGEVQAAGGGLEVVFCESTVGEEIQNDWDGSLMLCQCVYSTCYNGQTGAQTSQTKDCMCLNQGI